MDVAEATHLLVQTLTELRTHAAELRDLDAALGDGDLGITVDAGCRAVVEALGEQPAPRTPAELLTRAGRAFSTANPSTLAALVGGALLAAARSVPNAEVFDHATVLTIGRTAADSIAARGKAEVGDKTILDALVPSVAAMSERSEAVAALESGVRAARAGVEATAALRSRRGRAAWVGDRSLGLPDPGATAYLRFLESLLSTRQSIP